MAWYFNTQCLILLAWLFSIAQGIYGVFHANIVKVLIQNEADVNLISKASIIAIAKFIFEILTRI